MKKYLFVLIPLIFLASCGENTQIPRIAPASSSGVILALGDSLTIGYGLPETESYPAQLEKRLQSKWYAYTVQNAGVSWDTSAGLLSRIDWILEGETPILAILCIGSNDVFQWKNVDDIEANIRSIIEKLQAKKIPILLAGMKAPFNLWKTYRDQYDGLFLKLAKEYKLTFMPFLLEWIALDPKFNQDDRIHPTSAGYWVVVDNLLPILEENKLIQK